MNVLHIIQQLSRGGASQALAHLLAALPADAGRHRIASLLPPQGEMAARLRALGATVFEPTDLPQLRQEIAASDIVQVAFWNSPELYRLLRRELPAMRLLLWVMVAGDTAPHRLPDALLARAERTLLCCDYSWQLPDVQRQRRLLGERLQLLPLCAELDAFLQLQPAPHRGFRVGYAGSIDFAKMHPDFLALHSGLAIADLQLELCGDGSALPSLAQHIAAQGLTRFRLRGFVSPLTEAFRGWDVFGYPLAEGSYASAELVLQEAMAAGLPAVVLAHGSPATMVRHGQTGLVAADAAEYRRALEHLYRRPSERRRLGAQAREAARERFGAARMGAAMAACYAELQGLPKRSRTWNLAGEPSPELAGAGARAFIASLADASLPFRASLQGAGAAQWAAEQQIARAAPVLASAAAGGILSYRRAFPQDAHLALWAGLVLAARGRPALACAELHRAIGAGLDHGRVWAYLARCARAAGAEQLAADALERARAAAPEGELLKRWLEGCDGC